MKSLYKIISSTLSNIKIINILLIGTFITLTLVSFLECKVNGVSIDFYWMVNLGNYIKDHHELPQTNVWIITDNLKIQFQSLLGSLVVYGWYELFQENMLSTIILGYIYILIHTIAAYKYCRLHTENKSLALMTSAICTRVVRSMLMARPSLITSTVFYIELIILTRYYIRKDLRYWKMSISLALMSTFLVNWQSSAWLFLIILQLPFIAEELIKQLDIKNIKNSNWKNILKSLRNFLISILLIILSGLLNPYGYKNEIYILLTTKYGEYAQEIETFGTECIQTHMFTMQWYYIVIAIGILLIGIQLRKVSIHDTLLTLGTCIVALEAIRQSYMTMYGVAPILIAILSLLESKFNESYSKQEIKSSTLINCIKIFISFLQILAIYVIFYVVRVVPYTNEYNTELSQIVNYINTETEESGTDKNNINILCESTYSAYFQYYGYKTFTDTRCELLSSQLTEQSPRPVTSSRGYKTLYMDVMQEYSVFGYTPVDSSYIDNFMDYYDFDYAVLYNSNFITYLGYMSDWQEITEFSNNTEYKFYKRIRN